MAGYTSVLPTDTYTAATHFGWLSTAAPSGSFDRGAPNTLLEDGASGTDMTFLRDEPNGTYTISVVMGDNNFARDQMQIYAQGAASPIVTNLNSGVGTFATATFVVTVTTGQLSLRFKDGGGIDPTVVVNTLEIDASALTNTITYVPPTSLSANNGSNPSEVITAHTDLAAGTLVTVSASVGSISTADANSLYVGTQVVVTAGGGSAGTPNTISFTYLSPTNFSGPATLTASAIGRAATQNATLPITLPTTWHFDFNSSTNLTAAGYLGVRGSTTFTASTSFGWLTTAAEFDRGAPSNLLRDGAWGNTNTFRVSLNPGETSYTVLVTIGDNNYARQVNVLAEGVLAGPTISTNAGQFKTLSFTISTSSVTDGILDLQFKNAGADPYFVVNAIDIVGTPEQVDQAGAGRQRGAVDHRCGSRAGGAGRDCSLVAGWYQCGAD